MVDVSQPNSTTMDQERFEFAPSQSFDNQPPIVYNSKPNQFRHFKALMRKNAINWRRTLFGSLMEIICPILLMCLLVWARTTITPTSVNTSSIYQLQRTLYPTATLQENDQWTSDNYFASQNGLEMVPFMQHTDNIALIQVSNVTQVYSPLVDPLSPYYFLPPHCYNTLNSYTSPIIAYIGQDNQISKDMVDQLNALFTKQKTLIEFSLNFTRALQNPTGDSAVAVLMQIVDGGTTTEQSQVLERYGIDQEIVSVFQFLSFAEGLVGGNVNQTLVQEVEQIIDQQTKTGQIGTTQLQSDLLQSLVQGNMSLSDFESLTNSTLAQVTDSFGFTQAQSNQISTLVKEQQQQADLDQFLQSIGINQEQLKQLTTIVANVFVPGQDLQTTLSRVSQGGLDLIAEVFELDRDQTELLQSVSRVIEQQQPLPIENNKTESELTQYLNQTMFQNLGQFRLKKFESKLELDSYIESEDYGVSQDGVCFGFQIIEHSASKYELELFFNDLWPESQRGIPNQRLPAADPTVKFANVADYNLYVLDGFSQMQNWVANTILRRKTISDAQITTMVVPTRLQPTSIDNFTMMLQELLTLFMLLMYVPVLYRTVYRIVFEKVTRAQESMRIMGMTEFPYWASWCCYYTIINTVLVLCSWATLLINVISHESAFTLFLWMWVYGQSLFGLILLIQSLFSKPRSAAITTTMVYFGVTILTLLIDDEDTPRSTKSSLCWLFPTIAMTQTVNSFVKLDASGLAVTTETWGQEYQNFSVRDGVLFMCVSGTIVFLLGAYLEAVLPKAYGSRKHPCFFIKFCFKKLRKQLPSESLKNSSDKFETKYLREDHYEPAPREILIKELQGQVLKITDLRKQFQNGFKAVDGVNLKMYADQIFVLLGHNGAGKTTTLNMLTGMLNSSPGSSASVFGVDIFGGMGQVRRFMGVCPQHDILFELLTTEEHLSFFYDLKGADPEPKTKRAHIEKIMTDFGIFEKRATLAYQLSGGFKRKLSVAIALIGDSKFVLLDEPTCGMDLQSRRQLWNMLKQYKKDRIIVLTTHYMDEADILSDRIGIMSRGRIQCLGSSLFLKNKFGAGYNMTIVMSDKDNHLVLLDYLERHLGAEVKLLSSTQSEMTIQIPQAYSKKFEYFFINFDAALLRLGVRSYGISKSTLEEVFLQVGKMSKATVDPDLETIKSEGPDLSALYQSETEVFSIARHIQQNESPLDVNSSEPIKLDDSFLSCLVAVLYKRFSSYRRNRRAILNEVLLPALIMAVGFSVALHAPYNRSPSRLQTLDRLPQPQTLIMNSQDVSGNDLITLRRNLPDGFEFQTPEKRSFNEFGDYVFQNGKETPNYNYGAYQVFEADSSKQKYQFVSFVNITSQDAAGLYPQFMYEAILRTATQNPDFSFQVRTTPYPPTPAIKDRIATLSAALIIFITSMGYSVIITTIVSQIVVEREAGLKHLQVISGMQLRAYWVGNFIVDFIKLQLTIGITIACFFAYNMKMDSAYVTYLVLPFGILPFTYATSFIFSEDSNAQTFTMFFHFFTLAILSSLIFLLRFSPQEELIGDCLNFLMKLIPTYSLASSVFCDAQCKQLSERDGQGLELSAEVWAWENNLGDQVLMFFHLVLWTLVLIAIEKGYCRSCRIKRLAVLPPLDSVIDTDVEKEGNRIKVNEEELRQHDTIQVQNFRKDFAVSRSKSLTAVSNLSFSLGSGECFALLGVNGAGKSTTFKALTGKVKPTSGAIKIGGFNIATQFEKARKLIGYCPQSNLLFESMTVEEHIWYYARIKGLPQKHRTELVEQTINQLGLAEHRNKSAGTLSGGFMRKLCVAQAIVGNPPIILLDEPSAGMDPESRRFMWSVISKISQKKKSAVVLTTHHMEEAEALSTKMGIMVEGGKLECFGSSQHIKSKYGAGFMIQLQIKQVDEKDLWHSVKQFYTQEGVIDLHTSTVFDDTIINQIINKVSQNTNTVDTYRHLHSQVSLHNSIDALLDFFPEVDLLEQFGDYMKLRVRQEQSLGHVFGLMEKLKIQHDVCSYGVEQTSLEQIFQVFADRKYHEKVTKFAREYCEDPQFSKFHILTIKQN